MSYILRSARVAYDNIAYASATGKEKTILGSSNSVTTPKFNEKLRTSEGGVSTEPTTATDAARDRIITGSGGVTTLAPRETMINTN
jgi:hypothetical protein